MTKNEIQSLLKGLDHESLEDLRSAVVSEQGVRRKAVDISTIHHSMSDEAKREARAEISRILSGQE